MPPVCLRGVGTKAERRGDASGWRVVEDEPGFRVFAGVGGQGGVDAVEFVALGGEIGLVGEFLAEALAIGRQAFGGFLDDSFLFGEFDFEAAETIFEARDDAEGGQVLGIGDFGWEAGALQCEFDAGESCTAQCARGEEEVETADTGEDPIAVLAFEFAVADGLEERGPGFLAFNEAFALDVHAEGVAAGGSAPGDVLFDVAGAPSGECFSAFGGADCFAHGVLVVEMGRAQALQSGEFGFEPGFLHEAGIARRDGLGHGELVDFRAGVFETANAAIARHRHFDKTGLAFEKLPLGGIDTARGRIGVELDFVVFVALPLDPSFPLLDLRGEPGDVEMVEGFEPALGIDAGAHCGGGADENAGAPRIDAGEELLFGA